MFAKGSQPAPVFADTPEKRIPIKGKWTVRFQPGRLAPESVEWDKLIDWTRSEESGIKYFSGTATYSIQFEMPETATGDFWLDLGGICEVGEVSMFLPEEERITRTNMQGQHTKSSPLVPSGLIGPVTLQPVKQN
jgi:hypothetical protein